MRPANYRQWVFLSSGMGMAYGPTASADQSEPVFDNVFVSPVAYRAFLENGKWPESTIFVLEIRRSASHGSINRQGHFQTGLVEIEAEVKDSARFPDKWAFFALGEDRPSAEPLATRTCITCHSKNGAVDNTFVQFYPTLLEVAKKKGTLSPSFSAASN